jgi:hypothetical protein
LHYERIRIQENKLEIEKGYKEVAEKEEEIDLKVQADTKPQHDEKIKLTTNIM